MQRRLRPNIFCDPQDHTLLVLNQYSQSSLIQLISNITSSTAAMGK